MTVWCACGKPLHYSDRKLQAKTEASIRQYGPIAFVQLDFGRICVPQHYLALHKPSPEELANSKFPVIRPDGSFVFRYLYDQGVFVTAGPAYDEQSFTHVDPDDGQVRTFHIPKLRGLIMNHPDLVEEVMLQITKNDEEFITKNHGIEEEHIVRIMNSESDEPAIVCLFRDGTQLIVDGNHRIVARYRKGIDTIIGILVPEILWRKSLLMVPEIGGP